MATPMGGSVPKAWARLKKLSEARRPLVVEVVGLSQLGLEVRVGRVPGILPRSQWDLRPMQDEQAARLIGTRVAVSLIKVNPARKLVIVSRRYLYECCRCVRCTRPYRGMMEGDAVEGRVEAVARDILRLDVRGATGWLMPCRAVAGATVGQRLAVTVVGMDRHAGWIFLGERYLPVSSDRR